MYLVVFVHLSCGVFTFLVSSDAFSAMLLILLMALHNVRRLCECAFVSVYSPSGTINVSHYLIGIVLYTSFSFAVLVESSWDSLAAGKLLCIAQCNSLTVACYQLFCVYG